MFRKILSLFFDKTFLKFVLTGLINTAVGSAIMFVFYNVFGFSYWTSSASNYFFTSILSFFLNKYYTFSNKETLHGQAIRFIVNILACYLIAYGVAKRIVLYIFEFAGEKLQNNIAMLIGMVIFTALNYIGQRFFCFSGKREKDDKLMRD